MRTNSETVVGVVGANGQLGRQLASLEATHGFQVLFADRDPVRGLLGRELGRASLQSILDDSDIVHFAIPADGFEGQYKLRGDGQVGIIHHSVMKRSEDLNREHFGGEADIVHMLMNVVAKNGPRHKLLRLIQSMKHGFPIYPANQGTVVIEQSNPNLEVVKEHMSLLGLLPVEMKAQDHDRISAIGQGWQALGVQMLLPELKQAHENRLLTPSALALLEGLLESAPKLTAVSIDSILDNPELLALLNKLSELLAERGNS